MLKWPTMTRSRSAIRRSDQSAQQRRLQHKASNLLGRRAAFEQRHKSRRRMPLGCERVGDRNSRLAANQIDELVREPLAFDSVARETEQPRGVLDLLGLLRVRESRVDVRHVRT